MANGFLDIGAAIGQAGQLAQIQQAGEQRGRDTEARQLLDTYSQSLQTGTPDFGALQSALLKSPQLASQGLQGIGVVNQLQGREAANYLLPAVQAIRGGNIPLAQQLTQQRIQQLQSQGRDASDSQQILSLLQTDPQAAQNELLTAGAALGGAGQLGADQLNQLFAPPADDLELGRFKIANTPSGFSVVDSATAQIVSTHTDPTKAEEIALKRDKQQADLDAAKQKLKVTEGRELAAFASLEEQIGAVDELMAHPGRKRATGIGSAFPTLPGSEAADFESRLRNFAGGLALQATEQIPGVLSDSDIKLLRDVESGLDTGLSDKQFEKRLMAIEKKLKVNLARKKKQSPELFKQHTQIKSAAFDENGAELTDLSDEDLLKDLGL
jgi:hypothetical protein